jgi:hypothetical protein
MAELGRIQKIRAEINKLVLKLRKAKNHIEEDFIKIKIDKLEEKLYERRN